LLAELKTKKDYRLCLCLVKESQLSAPMKLLTQCLLSKSMETGVVSSLVSNKEQALISLLTQTLNYMTELKLLSHVHLQLTLNCYNGMKKMKRWRVYLKTIKEKISVLIVICVLFALQRFTSTGLLMFAVHPLSPNKLQELKK
jgi:hypothetical protein